MTEGVEGLVRDKTRASRIPPLATAVEQSVVARTLADPPGETMHWTAAVMAQESGISVSSVQRIWRRHGLRPHRERGETELMISSFPSSFCTDGGRHHQCRCPADQQTKQGSGGGAGGRTGVFHRHGASPRGADPGARNDEILGNQPEALILRVQQRSAQRVNCHAYRGLVPQPVTQLLTRGFGQTRCRRFKGVGLQIVDRKAQHQWGREARTRALRIVAAKPFGDVTGGIRDRQSADPDRGPAILRDPTIMCATQRQHLCFQTTGE